MSTIVTRAGKGSPLTHNEMDANFTNLNTDKIETDSVDTLTNKTIDLTDNILSGTSTEFNTACSDTNFVFTSDIGVTVQPQDATLTALAGVTTAADKLIYATGSDTFATTDLTAAGRAILDDANAAAQRITLNAQETLVSGTNIKTINSSSILGSGNLVVNVPDGDKGDLTVSSSGTVWTIDAQTITPAKLSQPFTQGASVNASGTSVDFTGIPAWVKRITVPVRALSTNGTSNPIIQIGDSGGFKTTGYTGSTWQANTANTANTVGFLLNAVTTAASVINSATAVLVFDGTAWNFSFAGSLGTVSLVGGGANSLTGTLDRLRLTTVGGGDTFDAGTINIMYEG